MKSMKLVVSIPALTVICFWLGAMSAPLPEPEDEEREVTKDYLTATDENYNFALACDCRIETEASLCGERVLSPAGMEGRKWDARNIDELPIRQVQRGSEFKIVKITKVKRHFLRDADARYPLENGFAISYVFAIEINNPERDRCILNSCFIKPDRKPLLDEKHLLKGEKSLVSQNGK